MNRQKTFTQDQIYIIIDDMIQTEMKRKNQYIELNGKNAYKHTDVMNRFDSRIAAFTEMYGKFKD